MFSVAVSVVRSAYPVVSETVDCSTSIHRQQQGSVQVHSQDLH